MSHVCVIIYSRFTMTLKFVFSPLALIKRKKVMLMTSPCCVSLTLPISVFDPVDRFSRTFVQTACHWRPLQCHISWFDISSINSVAGVRTYGTAGALAIFLHLLLGREMMCFKNPGKIQTLNNCCNIPVECKITTWRLCEHLCCSWRWVLNHWS